VQFVCRQHAALREFMIKPVVEYMHSKRTDDEDIERYTAAT